MSQNKHLPNRMHHIIIFIIFNIFSKLFRYTSSPSLILPCTNRSPNVNSGKSGVMPFTNTKLLISMTYRPFVVFLLSLSGGISGSWRVFVNCMTMTRCWQRWRARSTVSEHPSEIPVHRDAPSALTSHRANLYETQGKAIAKIVWFLLTEFVGECVAVFVCLKWLGRTGFWEYWWAWSWQNISKLWCTRFVKFVWWIALRQGCKPARIWWHWNTRYA